MNKQTLRIGILIGLFLVPFVPFLVSSAFFFPFITSKVFAWRIIVEIIFGAWVLLALLDPAYRPKRSPILYALLAFLAVVGLADLLGEEPVKSFWSNFERMEGYVAMLHLGAFFLVIGSVFKEVDWKRWWNTSLVASFLMVLYCFMQLACAPNGCNGAFQIHQGGVRVDGTLGNASYLAVYLLIHIFIALWFFLKERRSKMLAWSYGIVGLLQLVILYHTATRGAILGLIGGLLLIALLNIRNKEDRRVRRVSMALVVGLVACVGIFIGIKDSSFVMSSPVLSRFATISTEEMKSGGRAFVWPMAIKGLGEKPILGWGQDNFNYVFNKHYDPEMYRLEPWFDRAHNIFLDWLVAAGVLGLAAYLSLYGALLYLVWKDKGFSHLEKSVLTGLVAAYFFHNFFVFDHLISYILFFSLLGYIYSRSSTAPLWQSPVSESKVSGMALPAVLLVLALSLYFVNEKPMQANSNLIKALSTLGSSESVEYFQKAYNGSRLGRPEAVEQIVAHGPQILSGTLPMETNNSFFRFARQAIEGQAADMSGDARYQLMAGSFLSATGYGDEALVYFDRAVELMPGKQLMYFERGSTYLNAGQGDKALAEFKKAYDLAPEYSEAKVIYLVGGIYTGNSTVEAKLLGEIDERTLVFDDRILAAYYQRGRRLDTIRLLERRIILDPANEATYREYIRQVQNG